MYKGIRGIGALVLILLAAAVAAEAQSTLLEYPTPITGSEIRGTIQARAIGDARLTTYYYAFNGAQGDVFINVVTRNFNGDIDVFLENGLRPLTKIVMFADFEESETGRVIYLRRPERLILRVQGRTPNDDLASFQIKFAGSFVAMKEGEIAEPPDLPTVAPREIARIQPAPVEAPTEEPRTEDVPRVPEKTEPAPEPKEQEAAPVVVLEEAVRRESPPARTAPEPRIARPEPRRAEPVRPADPMANFSLVIKFRNGTTTVRPMTEITRFSVDRGVLTVVGKDGRSRRYQMSDIERVAIE